MPWNPTTNSHTRGSAVVDASTLTAPASFNATFTASEANALRADVAALQAKVNALLAALRLGGNI